MKRCISLLLTVCLLATMAAVPALAEAGTYTGVGAGKNGEGSIEVSVTLDDAGVITDVEVTKNGDDAGMSSDRMGMKHFVRFGLYEIKGSINVQLAEKTGFSEEDADTVKECLRTLFVNDASSARPDGSMEVVKLFWWRHSCKDGQYSSAKVHRSVKVALRDAGTSPPPQTTMRFRWSAAGSGAGGDRWHIVRRTSYSSPAYSISGFAGGSGR